MSENEINVIKEQAFNQIGDILMSIETPDIDGIEKTSHMLDVLEQLLARVIAGSSVNNETIEEMCVESLDNIKKMAKRFFHEENLKK
jgi:predicted metal-dependent TIM-barrel fold hydrolase